MFANLAPLQGENFAFNGTLLISSDVSWVLEKLSCFHLSFCYQAMYESIQKLDKKLDLLHRKVSEMQHTCARPLLLKPVSITELRNSDLPLILSFLLMLI